MWHILLYNEESNMEDETLAGLFRMHCINMVSCFILQ